MLHPPSTLPLIDSPAKSNEIIIDSSTIHDGDSQQFRIWRWKQMRHMVMLACREGRKVVFYDCGTGQRIRAKHARAKSHRTR